MSPPKGGQQQRPGGRRGRQAPASSAAPDTIEKVVKINHVSKVVKGGRRFGFSTIVVVGDGKAKVGMSIGKAKEVPESISKGRTGATKGMKTIRVVNGTIPHPVMGRCGASRVVLRPAVPGTGIIAGAPVRAIMEAAGIRDIISKTIGSSNAVNVVKAALDGLQQLRLPEEFAEMRGKPVAELFIAKRSRRAHRPEDEVADRAAEASDAEAAAAEARRRSGSRGSGRGSSSDSDSRGRSSSRSGSRSRDSRDSRYRPSKPSPASTPAPAESPIKQGPAS
ncbi:30S ribosomal protein S5 [bacterium]|nr:30S ribosomal protein S5 [bacterium]